MGLNAIEWIIFVMAMLVGLGAWGIVYKDSRRHERDIERIKGEMQKVR